MYIYLCIYNYYDYILAFFVGCFAALIASFFDVNETRLVWAEDFALYHIISERNTLRCWDTKIQRYRDTKIRRYRCAQVSMCVNCYYLSPSFIYESCAHGLCNRTIECRITTSPALGDFYLALGLGLWWAMGSGKSGETKETRETRETMETG